MMSTHRYLYLIVWLSDFAAFQVLFAVTRLMAERDTDLWFMGKLGAGFAVAMGASCFFSGRISDRIGRYRLILAGTVMAAMCTASCALFNESLWALPLAYILLATSLGMAYPPIIAWLNQGPQKRTRSGISKTLIRFCISWNTGMLCGMIMAGVLFKNVDPIAPIWMAVPITIINVVVVILNGRESATPVAAPASAQAVEILQVRRRLSAEFSNFCWIANMAGAFSMSMVMHLLPKLVKLLDIPSDHHGFIMAFSRVVVIGSYLSLNNTKFWHYRIGVSLIVQAVAVGGLITICFATGWIGILVGIAAVGILMGYNYFTSLYYSTTRIGDESIGAASGIHEATISMGFAVGALSGGWIGSVDTGSHLLGLERARAPYLLSIGVILLLAIVQIVIYCVRVRTIKSYMATAVVAELQGASVR